MVPRIGCAGDQPCRVGESDLSEAKFARCLTNSLGAIVPKVQELMTGVV